MAALPTVVLERLVAASLGGAVAVGIVWLALRLVPGISARVRCWLWWLASAKFLLLLFLGPVVSLPLLPEDSPGLRPSDGEPSAALDLRASSGAADEGSGPATPNGVAEEVEKALSPPQAPA
ncbi:MAG: hypothetical protein R3234_10235, partial [Thermoanaerobaculia bacterium]|nr:hypothetical protein [Thermoanaerobaculia bacterium]